MTRRRGAAGIIGEFKANAKDIKSADILDGFIAGGGQKPEHYEIVSYKGLIDKANLMGQKDVAKLLQHDLAQEERFAQQLEGLEKHLGKDLVASKPELVGSKK